MSHLKYDSTTGHLLRKTSDGHLINSLTAAPTITTTALPSAFPSTSYSFNLSATGGTTPYVWSITSGTLPSGLSLSSSGTISGTPTGTEGSYSITVKVTDNASQTDSVTFTLFLGQVVFYFSAPGWPNYQVFKLHCTDPATTSTSVTATWNGAGTLLEATLTPAQLNGTYSYWVEYYADSHAYGPMTVTLVAIIAGSVVATYQALLTVNESTPTQTYAT